MQILGHRVILTPNANEFGLLVRAAVTELERRVPVHFSAAEGTSASSSSLQIGLSTNPRTASAVGDEENHSFSSLANMNNELLLELLCPDESRKTRALSLYLGEAQDLMRAV